jgi:thioredoxin-like negative regulator of GroEL
MLRPLRWKSVFCVCLLAAAVADLGAQEMPGIQWRTDYNAARKEAEAKNLPVLIDFWRPACPPCEKLEAYTFRDPRILKALNENFIPLKVNGLDNIDLSSRLQVTLFPTLVLASPDGKIDKTLVGYQDADALNEHMHRLLASLRPPETMEKDYQNALKWELSGDYVRAISALKNILEDGKARPVQKSAQELLKKIEKHADERLAAAKELQEKGQFTEALEGLTDTLKHFPGLPASIEASDLIGKLLQANGELKVAQRTKRVRQLLTQAQDFYKSKDYIPCLDRCEIIIATYGDLPEGQQAFALAAEIRNNPEWLQAAADVMTDRLGGVYLALADSYLKRGEVQRAQFYLQRVVQAFPGSRLAESAQIRMTQLQRMYPEKDGVARP